jgi:hypothetical protein
VVGEGVLVNMPAKGVSTEKWLLRRASSGALASSSEVTSGRLCISFHEGRGQPISGGLRRNRSSSPITAPFVGTWLTCKRSRIWRGGDRGAIEGGAVCATILGPAEAERRALVM